MDQVYVAVALMATLLHVQHAQMHEPILRGILLSNETDIKFLHGDQESVVQDGESIVGVAVDSGKGLIFWSDNGYNKHGIWRAKSDGAEKQKIVSQDLGEVNGITVDWVNKHIYWTSWHGHFGKIEVSDYDGNNRRTLASDGVLEPRGIYADPINSFLFWGDQGSHVIERSRLDGSERVTLTSHGVFWPNQLAMDHFSNSLYWVDGWHKTLHTCSIGSKDCQTAKNLSAQVSGAIYGLVLQPDAVQNNSIGAVLVSAWGSASVISVPINKDDPVETSASGLGCDVLFSMTKISTSLPKGSHVCGEKDKGGCSHLCLPTGPVTYRCACPSYAGLVLSEDGKTCTDPNRILLYALGDTGEVGFIDVDSAGNDRNIIHWSNRPVAVTYDPTDKFVYWSDVGDHCIYRAHLDGTQREIFLNSSHGLGAAEGLAIDWVQRRLYFTNSDLVLTDNLVYGWHRIESIQLDRSARVTLVTDVQQPRGLWLDNHMGYLFYADQRSKGIIKRVNLDGSQSKVILDTGLHNPNGLIGKDGQLYITEAYYNTQHESMTNSRNGTIFKMTLSSNKAEAIQGLHLVTPFGLSIADDDVIYISDWGRNAIIQYNLSSGKDGVVLDEVTSPMGLHFTSTNISKTAFVDQLCGRVDCSDICLASGTNVTCACSDTSAMFLTSDKVSCTEPNNFFLVADKNTIKLVSHDDDVLETAQVSTIVQGDRYTSSFSALTFDPLSEVLYFSDVNSKKIYKSTLGSGSQSVVFTPCQVVDGLALDTKSSRLYWTAYEAGSIESVETSGNASTYREVLEGLQHPRALVIHSIKRLIYWTETGSTPRVSYAPFTGEYVTTLPVKGLLNPNALSLDTDINTLFVGDTGTGYITSCTLEGTSCEVVYQAASPQLLFSLAVSGDGQIFYADWKRHSLISIQNNHTTTIITGLMRPTQLIYVQKNASKTELPFVTKTLSSSSTKFSPANQQSTTEGADKHTMTTQSSFTNTVFSEATKESTTTITLDSNYSTATGGAMGQTISNPDQTTDQPLTITTTTYVISNQSTEAKLSSTVTAAPKVSAYTEEFTGDMSSKSPYTPHNTPQSVSSSSTIYLTKGSSVTEETTGTQYPVTSSTSQEATSDYITTDTVRKSSSTHGVTSNDETTSTSAPVVETSYTSLITVSPGCQEMNHPINHGALTCSEGACLVTCDQEFQRNPEYDHQIKCEEDRLQDALYLTSMKTLACLRSVPLVVQFELMVTLEGQCLSTDLYKTQLTSTLIELFKSQDMCTSQDLPDFSICESQLFTITCSQNDKPLWSKRHTQTPMTYVAITMKQYTRNHTELQVIQHGMTRLSQQIQQYLLNSSDSLHLNGQPLHILSADITGQMTGCPTGHQITDTGCLVCAAGSMHNATYNRCVICVQNTYQQNKAKTICQKCPGGTSAPAGASSKDQCIEVSQKISSTTTKPKTTTPIQTATDERTLALIIGGSIGSVVVLILVISLSALLVKRRKESGHLRMKNGSLSDMHHTDYMNPEFSLAFENPDFVEEDEKLNL